MWECTLPKTAMDLEEDCPQQNENMVLALGEDMVLALEKDVVMALEEDVAQKEGPWGSRDFGH